MVPPTLLTPSLGPPHTVDPLTWSSPDSIADGLDVDTVNNKLFYTDDGRDVIVSMNLDGTNEQTLISSGLDRPRAILADPHNR